MEPNAPHNNIDLAPGCCFEEPWPDEDAGLLHVYFFTELVATVDPRLIENFAIPGISEDEYGDPKVDLSVDCERRRGDGRWVLTETIIGRAAYLISLERHLARRVLLEVVNRLNGTGGHAKK